MIKRCLADKFFSWYIRELADWKCEKCGTQFDRKSMELHCSHFYGRRAESTRFDPNNAEAHCGGCHKRFTDYPREHVAWVRSRLGEKAYDELIARHNTMKKKNRAEEAKYWKQELKNLCEEKGEDFSIYK